MTEPLKVALVALNRPGYQSLALGYVRAAAERSPATAGRVAFQTLDLTSEMDPWWVAYRVLGMGPDVVGFSAYCWNARAIYDACRVIKRAAPETTLIVGGPEVGPIAEDVLRANPDVDAVVRGEGEVTFPELLAAMLDGSAPHEVPGVTARDGEEVVSAPDREPIGHLDSLPSPYLSGVLTPIDGGTYLESYRGCPFECAYCFESKGIRRIRRFSDERVRAEIEVVANSPDVTNFSFIDSVFNLTDSRLEWFAEVLEPYARKGLRLHTIEVDIERIDTDAARLLKRAGVASVEAGPQTVGERALAECRRRFDPEAFAAGVAALKSEGIRVECDLIVGLPGDDVFDFLAGLRYCYELDPGIIQSSTLHVLPGTDLWERAEELGLRFNPLPPHEVVATPGADYRDLRRAEVFSQAFQNSYRARL